MDRKEKIEKLNKFIEQSDSKWLERAEQRKNDRGWLKLSNKIAARIITVLKQRKMTQRVLAREMEVSPQYINKILKGNEKFQIDTICKLEQCLGVALLQVPDATEIDYPSRVYETGKLSIELHDARDDSFGFNVAALSYSLSSNRMEFKMTNQKIDWSKQSSVVKMKTEECSYTELV